MSKRVIELVKEKFGDAVLETPLAARRRHRRASRPGSWQRGRAASCRDDPQMRR